MACTGLLFLSQSILCLLVLLPLARLLFEACAPGAARPSTRPLKYSLQLGLMATFGDLPTEVAQKCVEFVDEYREFGTPVAHYTHLTLIAQAWSHNWQDRDKARSFVAEAGRIQRAWARRSFPGTYQLEEEPLG